MFKSKKLIVTVLILILAVSVAAAVFFANQNNSVQHNFGKGYEDTVVSARTQIWQDINSGKTSSGTVAIMDNGQIVYSEGFGMADRENSTPVDTNTLFNIGSISKTYCTTAVMLLVDDGKVKLDDPVTKYIPDFVMADPRYENITVRMLLDHSSGLPGTISANDVGYGFNDAFYSEVLAALSQAHLKADPGAMAPYTNDGFTLAEILVARVSGINYSDFLSQRIFKPLSLDHTGVSVGQQTGKTIASFYQPDTGKKVPAEVLTVLGAGGLSATAEDMVRFADSFSNGGKHILSQSSIDEMTKAQPSLFAVQAEREAGMNPEFAYGLGLDIAGLADYQAKGIHVISKGGDTDDYHSMLFLAMGQRISVAVIEAGHGSTASNIAFNIFNSVLQQKGLIEKQDVPVSKPPTPQTIPSQYASFEGFYLTNFNVSFNLGENACTFAVVVNGQVVQSSPMTYRDGYFYGPTGNRFAFISIDGQDYLVTWAFGNNMATIVGQKLQKLDNPLSLKIDINGTQWLRRNVRPFEAMSATASHFLVAYTIDGLPGYVDFSGIKQIESPTYAGMPCGSVRDQTELNLVDKNGEVWAQVYDTVYSPVSDAAPLKNGANTATIGNDGYNQWFKASQDVILSFQMPMDGRVVVFSAPGSVTYDSVMNKGDVFIPQGSFVEMAGTPGDTFTVTAK